MNRKKLVEQIKLKQSYLCIGLDTDKSRIPKHLQSVDDPVFEFNKAIIDSTKDLCVSYKINTAFYEAEGLKGWESMMKTLAYIPEEIFTIADAKRGDIGNSTEMYAKAFFENMNFDSITVAPYMGSDSVKPFFKYKDKWAIVLILTSNPSSEEIQTEDLNSMLTIGSPGILNRQRWMKVYEHVLYESKEWGNAENLMYVIGATQTGKFDKMRQIIPDNFILIPGVGAQGGSLSEVSELLMNNDCGILVNSSRQIIYAGTGHDFSSKAREAAIRVQQDMSNHLKKKGII